MPVSQSIWEDINIDFVLKLPKTPHHVDSIMVVIDRFLKMAHFMACKKTFDATHVDCLFFAEVVWLPRSITSNRDIKFASHFWQEFWKRFHTTLQFSSAYHPQTDGQTKSVNRTLGNMLRCLARDKQKQWDLALTNVEFVFNNVHNCSTRYTPFAIIYAKMPNFIVDLLDLHLPKRKVAGTFVANVAQVCEEVQRNLEVTNVKYK